MALPVEPWFAPLLQGTSQTDPMESWIRWILLTDPFIYSPSRGQSQYCIPNTILLYVRSNPPSLTTFILILLSYSTRINSNSHGTRSRHETHHISHSASHLHISSQRIVIGSPTRISHHQRFYEWTRRLRPLTQERDGDRPMGRVDRPVGGDVGKFSSARMHSTWAVPVWCKLLRG